MHVPSSHCTKYTSPAFLCSLDQLLTSHKCILDHCPTDFKIPSLIIKAGFKAIIQNSDIKLPIHPPIHPVSKYRSLSHYTSSYNWWFICELWHPPLQSVTQLLPSPLPGSYPPIWLETIGFGHISPNDSPPALNCPILRWQSQLGISTVCFIVSNGFLGITATFIPALLTCPFVVSMEKCQFTTVSSALVISTPDTPLLEAKRLLG